MTETLLSEAEEQALKNGPIATKNTSDKEEEDEEEEEEEEEAGEDDEDDHKKARKKIISTWHLHPSRQTPAAATGKGKKRIPVEESVPVGRIGRHGELVGPRLTLRMLSKSDTGKGIAALTKLVWHHKGN